MNSSRLCHIEVARPVTGKALHSFNMTGHGALGKHISLVLSVKELYRKIGFEVDDRVRVHEVVEVLLFVRVLALNDKVLREDIRSVSRLED